MVFSAQVEQSQHCKDVIMERSQEGHVPIAPVFDDVRNFHLNHLSTEKRQLVSGVVAGFPCQAHIPITLQDGRISHCVSFLMFFSAVVTGNQQSGSENWVGPRSHMPTERGLPDWQRNRRVES